MSETKTPVDEGFLRDFKDLQRKVQDISNAAASGIQLVPGDLVASAAADRNGCLLCDGAAVDRITYAALFTAIGTLFGAGDGVTTFNVPDYQGRVIVGSGSGSGLTTRALAAAFGLEAVTLAGAESGIASHNHTVANTTGAGSSHTHSGTTGNDSSDHHHSAGGGTSFVVSGGSGTGIVTSPSSFTQTDTVTSGRSSVHTHPFTTGAEASHTHTIPDTDVKAATAATNSHENCQPSLAINIFIKC